MIDRKTLSDQPETPEDVASLYSWANLHGAKYRDFSASRAQTREKARLRVEESLEEEERRTKGLADAQEAAEAQRVAERKRSADTSRRAEYAAQGAALEEQRQTQDAARHREIGEQQAEEHAAAQEAADRAARHGVEAAAEQSAYLAAEQAAEQRARKQGRDFASASHSNLMSPPEYQPVPPYETPGYAAQSSSQPLPALPQPSPPFGAPRDDGLRQPGNPWPPPDLREPSGRPAWLMNSRPETPPQPASAIVSPAPSDSLQGSRDRMTSRWFALRTVFDPGPIVQEAAPAPAVTRAPVIAVFSLAGGVGKTSLVATLGRALSARGERVLLVDTASFGLLPFFFGARDQRPGQLRTFSPPGVSSDAPVQMITLDPETLGAESAGQEMLSSEISKYSRGVSRVIVDLATASGATTRRVLRMQPMILVPVTPDMNSVVSVNSIDAFFQNNGNPPGRAALPYYVLNQFDPSLPLNLDVREVLREQLGDRLLPFAIRRSPTLSEALAEGMTVMDYAPNSTLAEDFGALAGWIKGLSAAANTTYRGVRWSER